MDQESLSIDYRMFSKARNIQLTQNAITPNDVTAAEETMCRVFSYNYITLTNMLEF